MENETKVPVEQAAAVNSPAIRAALEEIVSSPEFGRAERPARFLRHLVETALNDENHRLKESVLGVEVFGRPASWDPRLDAIVRQEAARLRKRLARYYESAEKQPAVRIELPVGTYVPVFRSVFQPVEPPLATTTRPKSGHTRLYLAAAVLACAAVLIAVWASHRGSTLSWDVFSVHQSPASLAVLPFTNLTADPANQYFADGFTDEITDSLGRVKLLQVAARSSAFEFKGKAVDVREVGRLLHVANILEGSVARSGDRIRVIAHLERVSDGAHIWSNTYERPTSDLFALQSELVAGIAGSLKASSGVLARKHIPQPEAHELVIKARYDMQEVTRDSIARAETEYQQAIDLDPEYAAAYLGLASARYDQFVARGSAYQTQEERKGAEQLCRKALELDPDLSTAHVLLAALSMQYDWNWAGAERDFRLAVAGPPNANAESFYAFFLIFRGRFSEADQHIQRMLDLDPFSTATMNNLVAARNLEGRFAEARRNAERLVAQYGKIVEPKLMIGMAYIGEGSPKLALPVFEQMKPRFPQAALFEAMARARAGQREEALTLIRPFEEEYRTSGASMSWFALVYALMGDEPNTVKWLSRSADLHEWQALNIAVNPAYAPMRSSPAFQALEKRMGLQ